MCHSKFEMTTCHREFEMTVCHREFEMTVCHREFEMTICHRKFETTMCHKKFEMTMCHRKFLNDCVPQGICKWPCATKNLKWPCATGNLKWPCATIIFNQFSLIFMTPGTWNFPNNFFLKNEKKNSQNLSHFENENTFRKRTTFWKWKPILTRILKKKASFWKSG